MSAYLVGSEQAVAIFVLHALWQVSLLASAAWGAVKAGRPHVRAAHAIWVGTLLLCVALPVCSTVAARHAALQAERDVITAGITFKSATYDRTLPSLQRESTWKRLLHRHVNGRDGLKPFAFMVPRSASRWISWSYLAAVAFFASQLLAAWRRMQILVRRSSCKALPTGLEDALRRQCAHLGLAPPAMRSSGAVAGPVLAGVLRPTLLLPTRAVAEMNGAEIEAVLLHELAHLRRRDPLLHALCSVLLLPVSFHPAAWWTSQRIRQTREMACDAEAAGQIGSNPAYARSLLQVAERIEVGHQRFSGLGLFGNGLFGAGLELFNRSGAMEERMQMLIKSRPIEARSRRVARVAACVSLGATAVLAAGMLQVRPALAGERTAQQEAASPGQGAPAIPQEDGAEARLLSGDHARDQLRQARRELAKAEQEATSDEDRRRISTARGIAAAAESAQAQTDSSNRDLNLQVDLSRLQVKLSDLKMPDIDISMSHLTPQQEAYRQSPEWKAKLEKQRAYFNSPEWKANIDRQHAYFDSPEWKTKLEKQRAYFSSPEWKDKIAKQRAIFDSPEWKAHLEQQQQAMEKLRTQMNSPEFRAKIEAAGKVDQDRIRIILLGARKQQEQALEQIRSGAIQRQIDQATQLVARNEVPVLVPPVDADQPVKIASGVMAGNVTHKEQPVYPAEAKEKKIQGAVLLHAIITEDGKVERLSVVSSPDKLLSDSAIDAVQKWTYKPYLLNGKPTAVDTTITVNYSFAP